MPSKGPNSFLCFQDKLILYELVALIDGLVTVSFARISSLTVVLTTRTYPRPVRAFRKEVVAGNSASLAHSALDAIPPNATKANSSFFIGFPAPVQDAMAKTTIIAILT